MGDSSDLGVISSQDDRSTLDRDFVPSSRQASFDLDLNSLSYESFRMVPTNGNHACNEIMNHFQETAAALPCHSRDRRCA